MAVGKKHRQKFSGWTAQLLMENGFRCVDVEDFAEIHESVSCCAEIPKMKKNEFGEKYIDFHRGM